MWDFLIENEDEFFIYWNSLNEIVRTEILVKYKTGCTDEAIEEFFINRAIPRAQTCMSELSEDQ